MKINTQNKTIKKLLSAVLTASIITTSFASVVQASAQTTGENSNQEGVVQTTASSAEPTKEFVINNKDDLSKFMSTSEYWGSNYKITLAHDIDMEWATLNPIYKFDGVFDGCKHKISNLKVEDTRKGILGFDVAFINILSSSAQIKNVEFDNCDIIANDKYETHAAVLVVANHGNISGVCINSARINYDNKNNKNVSAGGLVYSNEYNGTIYNCDMGDYYTSYHFASSVCVNGNRVGGFAYFNDGIIDRCYSYTKVKGQDIAGGFVGKNMGSICNSYSYSNGIEIHEIREMTNICGGFVGINERGSKIINCFVKRAFDKISTSSSRVLVIGRSYAGGFAGINKSEIYGCGTNSKVRSRAIAGGFVGENNEEGKITGKCIAAGEVRASTGFGQAKAGGFVGVNKANIEASTASGYVYLGAGMGRTNNGCGGFVGKNDQGGKIYNKCYAECTVETYFCTKGGGFVGEAKNGSEIHDSSCETKRVTKDIISRIITNKKETESASFWQHKDKKAVIKNCHAD